MWNNDRPVTVYLVDDEEIVRSGARRILQAAGAVIVGESASASVAYRDIVVGQPDVVVVDAELPDGAAMTLCRDLGAAEPDVGVLVLVPTDDEATLFTAIDAGARGCLLRGARAQQFVETVSRIARGQACLDPAVTGRVLARVRRQGVPTGDGRGADLTLQERRVLGLVAEGLTNREIGVHLSLAEKTVKNYVTTILAKLGLQRRSQAVVWVTRNPAAVRPLAQRTR